MFCCILICKNSCILGYVAAKKKKVFNWHTMPMPFLASFSIGKMLKSMSILVIRGLHTLLAMSSLQIPSIARICGHPVVYHMCSLLSKEDLLVGLRRRGFRSLMNLEITERTEEQAFPSSARHVESQGTIGEVAREKQEGTPPYLGIQTKPEGPLGR